jgi:hypothetical protein
MGSLAPQGGGRCQDLHLMRRTGLYMILHCLCLGPRFGYDVRELDVLKCAKFHLVAFHEQDMLRLLIIDQRAATSMKMNLDVFESFFTVPDSRIRRRLNWRLKTCEPLDIFACK